jgi:hypothetical protein
MDYLFIQGSNASTTSIFDYAYRVEDRSIRIKNSTHLLGYYGSMGGVSAKTYMYDYLAKLPPVITYGAFKPIIYMTRKLRY